MKHALLAGAVVAASIVTSAEAAVWVIGAGPSRDCYVAAVTDRHDRASIDVCDLALNDDFLIRRDRAATVAKIPDKYARAMPLLFSGVVELPPRRQEVGAKYIFTGDCYAFQRGGGWPADQLWQAVIVNETLNIDTPADWLKFNESLRRVRV